jgi:hypothetical protein
LCSIGVRPRRIPFTIQRKTTIKSAIFALNAVRRFFGLFPLFPKRLA